MHIYVCRHAAPPPSHPVPLLLPHTASPRTPHRPTLTLHPHTALPFWQPLRYIYYDPRPAALLPPRGTARLQGFAVAGEGVDLGAAAAHAAAAAAPLLRQPTRAGGPLAPLLAAAAALPPPLLLCVRPAAAYGVSRMGGASALLLLGAGDGSLTTFSNPNPNPNPT